MTSSLVGSEMCIRDRSRGPPTLWIPFSQLPDFPSAPLLSQQSVALALPNLCLLYTSDAADDM
eukprot:2471763-Prorocentrum_lima.AAC.1